MIKARNRVAFGVLRSGKQVGETLPIMFRADDFSEWERSLTMAEDTKVYPTGLTEKEAVEINEGLKWGTRIFGAIAILAHILAYALTPWLH